MPNITDIKTDNKMTLREGLDGFYEKYQDFLSHNKEGTSSNAQAFFKSHDVAHVLFACDISLYGEGKVKMWTIFGTTLGFWGHLNGYREANAFQLARSFTLGQVVANIFRFLASIPTLIIRANRMHKPWPWKGFLPYLDTPIVEIRREFNIHVL